MSTTASTPSPRVYRGRCTAELIPTIQAELGPEAIVLARRSGLEGGIGGFFQRPFVEIEAQPGGPRIDLYDGDGATLPQAPAPAPDPAPATAPTKATATATATATAEAVHTLGAVDFAAQRISPVEVAASSPMAVAPSAHDFRAAGLTGAAEPNPNPAPSALDDAFANVLAAASTQQLATSYDQLGKLPAAQFDAQLETRSTTQLEPRGTTELDRQPATSPPAADELADAAGELAEAEAIVASRVEPAQRTQRPTTSKVALAVAAELQAIGFEERFAAELIEEAGAHVIPFAPRIGLRRAVRVALERRIPVATPLPGRGAALALVGPGGSGKTKCAAALASAYRQTGTLAVGCASISTDTGRDSLRMVFSPRITTPAQAHSQRSLKAIAAGRAEGVVLLDTPAVSPSQGAEVKQLGRVLAQIGPDRTLAMLPATLGAKAAGQLLAALAPLQTSALAITHADETDQLGVAVQAACSFGIAPEYVLTGAAGTRAVERIDPAALAARLVP